MTFSFADAINKAFIDAMEEDNKVICMGLGVPDPKGVFGTTLNLEKKFGKNRVFDIPTSENAVTGICVGLSLGGYKPVLTHQRVDFALLSLDQIINNAAKIKYMFGGSVNSPIVIRMIVGRGWGQGPTHSQNLQMLFSGIPGLRVAIPGTPNDAYSMLRASIKSADPIIFLEHRWLHNSMTSDEFTFFEDSLKKQTFLIHGDAYTVVANSYMIPEAIRAMKLLKEVKNISGDLINFRNYHLDSLDEIKKSVKKTNRILFIDTAQENFSIAHAVILKLKEEFPNIEIAKILATPNVPEPTSHFLTKKIYLDAENILKELGDILKISIEHIVNKLDKSDWHDVPGDWFKGPF